MHHQKWKKELEFCASVPSHLPERDQIITRMVNFVSYKTPSDSIDIVVRELPEEYEIPDDIEKEEIAMKKAQALARIHKGTKRKTTGLGNEESRGGRHLKELDQASFSTRRHSRITQPYCLRKKSERRTVRDSILTSTDKQSCSVSGVNRKTFCLDSGRGKPG